MVSVEGEVGDKVLQILDMVYSAEHRPSMERAASERGITLNQFAAASIAGRLAQEYVITDPRRLSPMQTARKRRRP